MKFVRIDALGTAELHPRLTLLRGVTPEQRRRIEDLLHSISDTAHFDSAGMIEVNGVQLNLDGDTVERLRLDVGLGWILDWGTTDERASAPLATPKADTPADTPPDTPAGTVVPGHHSEGRSTQVNPADDRLAQLDSLRETLRATAAERTQLAGQMDQVRERLDSFANAALEVCVGQIDALEAKRATLRRQVETQKSAVDSQLLELEATYQDHLAEIDAVENLDLTEVRVRRDELSAAIDEHRGPDPQSLELALRIDATMRRVRDLGGQAAAVSLRRREAEQRLAECVAELNASERAMKQRTFDPAIVARLEQVRDELFADDERPSRLSVNRNRRRMLSLRDEEAKLLGQLGFDTYSSYVMGIPSMRSEVERSARVDHARARVDEIQRELDSMDEPAEALLIASETDLRDLLATAATVLGDGPKDSTDDGVLDPAADNSSGLSSAWADEVAHVIERLRSTQLDTGVDGHPAVLAAADELRRAISSLAGGRFADPTGARSPRIAGSAIAPQSWNAEPSALLGAVDVWLERLGDTSAWLKSARDAVEQLRSQIEDLSDSGETPLDVSEWAKVEAELDSLLDKLVGAQERVRRNEEALVELAGKREQELVIRARERELLARIAEVEEAIRSTPAPTADVSPAAPPEAALQGEASPAAAMDVDASRNATSSVATLRGDGGRDPDPEWTLVKFAARRRSVSFAGSLPVVVFNLADCGAAGSAGRDQVFERMVRLSELVQIVLIDDSKWAAERIGALGMAARAIQL